MGELFWLLLGIICAQKSDLCAFVWCVFVCLFLASLVGGLRHQFGRIVGHFGVYFGVILQLCWCCCKTAKMKHLISENLVFWSAGLFCFHHFRKLFEVFFGVAVKVTFLCDFGRFGPPKGTLFVSILPEITDFACKKTC